MFLSEITVLDPNFSLVPWVVLFPAIGLVINLLFGRYLKEVGSGIIASLAAGLAFVVAVLLAIAMSGYHEAVIVPFAHWINVGSLNVNWVFRIDTLSITMMMVVAGVGTLIHIYAIGYMHNDVRHNGDPGRYQRFFVFFNLFIVAMMILVSANNYLMLFVGWEGVGLCSYLLIGFWFEKGEGGTGNAKAAKKAFIVNRIGDFGLLLAMFLIFWNFGSLNFGVVFEKAPELAAVMPGVIIAITLFLLLGVTGKSAQLPLFVWLPDAMAGPTPVSALIHAATMVTAGVYLVARSAPLFVLAPVAQEAVMWVGALTALFAATIAIAQNDIKKVLAYSTISQLGFMVAAVGMGAFVAGMFHLVTHAFFKALLFLSSGSVIQGVERGMEAEHHDEDHSSGHGHIDAQDMRNMGGLKDRMPVTFWVFLTGALALAGIVPLAGFFSKDEILASASHVSITVYFFLAAAAFMTAYYMGRQILMVFFGKPRTEAAQNATESSPVVTVPLIILALLSLAGGALNFPYSNVLSHWLEHTFGHNNLHVEFNVSVALISTLVALVGLFLAWLAYGKRATRVDAPDPLEKELGAGYIGMQNKWWVDELYDFLFVKPYHAVADFLAERFDLKGIDGIVNGFGSATRAVAGILRRPQSGYVHSYVFSVMLGVVLILAYLISR